MNTLKTLITAITLAIILVVMVTFWYAGLVVAAATLLYLISSGITKAKNIKRI